MTASRTADSKASATSSISRATLRPRPPPPKAALIAIGRPCSSANATASSAFSSGSLVPGASGAPTFSAMWRALTLSPRFSIARRRRADPDQAGVDHGLGEVGVLGEEAVAGVHRVGAGLLGDVDDLLDVEVGVGRGRAAERVRLVGEPHEERVAVGLGVHRHAADAGVLAGADHAHRDLAAVGDEDLLQRLALRHLMLPLVIDICPAQTSVHAPPVPVRSHTPPVAGRRLRSVRWLRAHLRRTTRLLA